MLASTSADTIVSRVGDAEFPALFAGVNDPEGYQLDG